MPAHKPEPWESGASSPFLWIETARGKVEVWALGEDRLRITAPGSERIVTAYEEAERAADALAERLRYAVAVRRCACLRSLARGQTPTDAHSALDLPRPGNAGISARATQLRPRMDRDLVDPQPAAVRHDVERDDAAHGAVLAGDAVARAGGGFPRTCVDLYVR
jgi:hypothetical protein